MAKYKVTQVSGSDGKDRRSVTVSEDQVSRARAFFNKRSAQVPAESSDMVRVTKK